MGLLGTGRGPKWPLGHSLCLKLPLTFTSTEIQKDYKETQKTHKRYQKQEGDKT